MLYIKTYIFFNLQGGMVAASPGVGLVAQASGGRLVPLEIPGRGGSAGWMGGGVPDRFGGGWVFERGPEEGSAMVPDRGEWPLLIHNRQKVPNGEPTHMVAWCERH